MPPNAYDTGYRRGHIDCLRRRSAMDVPVMPEGSISPHGRPVVTGVARCVRQIRSFVEALRAWALLSSAAKTVGCQRAHCALGPSSGWPVG